jgi:hypothetical protein
MMAAPSSAHAANPPAQGLSRLLAWRRLRFTLLTALPFGLLMSVGSETSTFTWLTRTVMVGLFVLLAYGVFEQWPSRLPGWLARWVLQLLAVVAAVPIGALTAYWVTTGGDLQFGQEPRRLYGLLSLCFVGVLFARLHLLQAQVAPHFLFNTLANIRALVNTGSPQAPAVLDSLIAYLRAAVPRLNDAATTLGQELQLVRAYLELMHMRMPDRLQFVLHADDAAKALRCPPMTLLTLVENAVRHGIDPSEEGGRIEVSVAVRGERCIARVIDTGVGLQQAAGGLGTGLATLRERMQLAFGGDAQLRLSGVVPKGVCAELEFPAQPAAA